MTKPIDWTKPLRVVGTHEKITRVVITVDAITVARHCDSEAWPMFSNGRAQVAPFSAVENIPPEPRIVERWILIMRDGEGDYLGVSTKRLDAPANGYVVAKVLIEEPA